MLLSLNSEYKFVKVHQTKRH